MRVSPKPLSDYPWFIRLFFLKQKKTYGRVLDPGLLWGRSPWVFASLALLYGALDRKGSPLSPRLRSLITVRISQINHCAFCVDINSATLEKRGADLEKIDALAKWRESSLFDDRERAALDYAEAVTRTDGEVDKAMTAELKKHFGDDALIELTALIAFQNLSSKFNSALDVPPQGFCKIPPPKEETT
ncbi:MAG: carboxymuconolactone decarboxylase family protein [Rhodospirillales bacterium]